MTLTQYKKIIASLPREELEAHLVDLFKSNKVFKDVESTTWDENENSRLLEELEKKLEKVFWKERFSLSECKAVLKDYEGRTISPSTIALMYLAFATEAAELSSTYGNFGERFYNSLEKAAEVYLDYARTDEAFFTANDDKFQHLIETTADIGYGVSENLEEMYYSASAEVYGGMM